MKRILILLILLLTCFAALAEDAGENPDPQEEMQQTGLAALNAGTEFFSDAGLTILNGTLRDACTVYVISTQGDSCRIAVCIGTELKTGYVSRQSLTFLTEEETASYAETTVSDVMYAGFPLVSTELQSDEGGEGSEEEQRPTPSRRTRTKKLDGSSRGTPESYTHVKGTREGTPYWGVIADAAEVSDGNVLLGNTQIGISAEEAELIEEDEGKKILRVSSEETITVSGEALRTLRESGIAELDASAGEYGFALSTGGFLEGEVYNSLRSQGITDSRMEFTFSVSGGEVIAEDERYLLLPEENGKYVLKRGDE